MKALDVPNGKVPKGPPMDGFHYLQLVRQEARRAPRAVVARHVVAEASPVGPAVRTRESRTVAALYADDPVTRSRLDRWRCAVVADFDALRMGVMAARQAGQGNGSNASPALPPPKPSNERGWQCLCCGSGVEAAVQRYEDEDSEDWSDCDDSTGVGDGSCMARNVAGQRPLWHRLAAMQRVHVVALLDHVVTLFRTHRSCAAQLWLWRHTHVGAWLFAALACLEDPVDRHTHAALYTLLTASHRMREHVHRIRQTSDADAWLHLEASTAVLIAIIEDRYGQRLT